MFLQPTPPYSTINLQSFDGEFRFIFEIILYYFRVYATDGCWGPVSHYMSSLFAPISSSFFFLMIPYIIESQQIEFDTEIKICDKFS